MNNGLVSSEPTAVTRTTVDAICATVEEKRLWPVGDLVRHHDVFHQGRGCLVLPGKELDRNQFWVTQCTGSHDHRSHIPPTRAPASEGVTSEGDDICDHQVMEASMPCRARVNGFVGVGSHSHGFARGGGCLTAA